MLDAVAQPHDAARERFGFNKFKRLPCGRLFVRFARVTHNRGDAREAVNGRLKRALGIRDAEECTVEVTRGHVSMIRSYLQALDLLDEIDVMTLTDTREDSVRQLFL